MRIVTSTFPFKSVYIEFRLANSGKSLLNSTSRLGCLLFESVFLRRLGDVNDVETLELDGNNELDPGARGVNNRLLCLLSLLELDRLRLKRSNLVSIKGPSSLREELFLELFE